jgi:hypothetical protein
MIVLIYSLETGSLVLTTLTQNFTTVETIISTVMVTRLLQGRITTQIRTLTLTSSVVEETTIVSTLTLQASPLPQMISVALPPSPNIALAQSSRQFVPLVSILTTTIFVDRNQSLSIQPQVVTVTAPAASLPPVTTTAFQITNITITDFQGSVLPTTVVSTVVANNTITEISFSNITRTQAAQTINDTLMQISASPTTVMTSLVQCIITGELDTGSSWPRQIAEECRCHYAFHLHLNVYAVHTNCFNGTLPLNFIYHLPPAVLLHSSHLSPIVLLVQV